MVGRPKKEYPPLFEPLCINFEDGREEILEIIPVLCPECRSAVVGVYGTHKRKGRRVQYYQCKNPACSFNKTHNTARQFALTTSGGVREVLDGMLGKMTKEIMKGKISQSAIAEKYGVSDALICYLRSKIEKTISNLQGLKNLVVELTNDTAVAEDETFIRINSVPFYIIMFTGYTSHKILRIKVSKTRNEKDIREVFEEANRNTKLPINVVTADAWGATQTMSKNLMRKITLVIHKHKKPYDKAVIWHIDYEKTKRIITKIGLKTNFFKKRGKREYFYLVNEDNLSLPVPKKRGRPKGVKNGQGKQRKNLKPKMKRGRKGLFTVFDRGKRGYAKIDPSRKTLILAKGVLPAVAAAFRETQDLFWKKSISNNLAENINSVIETRVHLTGPKTAEGLELRLRAFIIARNNPEIFEIAFVSHKFSPKILFNEWNNSGIKRLFQLNENWGKKNQTEVLMN
ncbi:MAG: ogr/Delta-like zinc finger family protein [Candidatus Lokiarchaeota archaeon]|nr:ogr/Delta-like zinc finger family protein [Candidatus Harpocratesius repetitus]